MYPGGLGESADRTCIQDQSACPAILEQRDFCDDWREVTNHALQQYIESISHLLIHTTSVRDEDGILHVQFSSQCLCI